MAQTVPSSQRRGSGAKFCQLPGQFCQSLVCFLREVWLPMRKPSFSILSEDWEQLQPRGGMWQSWGGTRYCGFSNFNSRDRCLVCDAPKGFVGKLKPKRGNAGGASAGGEEGRASVPPPKMPPAPKRKAGAKGQEQEQEDAGSGGEQKSPMQQAKSKSYQL